MVARAFTVGAPVVVLAIVLASCAAAGTTAPGSFEVQDKLQVLDVPYVPQSGALCGGAALAMVLRYWGESGVLAEDFTALVNRASAVLVPGPSPMPSRRVAGCL